MESGELRFLEWLAKTASRVPSLEVPLGDDGAVWTTRGGDRLVLVADAIAEGTHFRRDDSWELVGRKALAVNLSDVAAMGGKPLCALATCALPRGFPPEMARGLTTGLRRLADEFRCPLVGGDTVTHDGGIVLSVTVVGELQGSPAILRSGARAGDWICLTGAIGGSIQGRHLSFVPRLRESARLVAIGPPSAMMDVSDGLLLDLWRMADASGMGFRLDVSRIPIHSDANSRTGADGVPSALSDGEDFELLFTWPRERLNELRSAWDLETTVSVIGEIVPEGRTLVLDGREHPASPRGYIHA